MGFFYENKGVISIFLIIIMLPLLTSAVLLVDGTRYQSAKTMAQEAGDLAAYSTIANYNMDLKDEFGLFAMADQDVTAEFKKYLTETLGYSVDEAESYSQKVQDLISSSVFGGGSYKDADFFNMYNFKVENATATPLYPLSDPAVLQNQIVEYSKYRGVETILERFEILSKFDKVDEETKEAQETMAAIENLSAIEESYVTTVSRGVADLKVKTDEYNKSLSEIFGLMNTFYDCAGKEISAFAVKDSSISDKKQARIDAYNDVLATLDELETAAAEINTKAANLSADAQKAKEKLEAFQNNHPDQEDAVRTAGQDIEILDALLEQKETEYSLWYLRQNTDAQQMSTLKTSLKSNMEKLIKAIQTTYTNYQHDTTNAEDAGAVRYHFTLKNNSEWWGTADDHTNDGSKPEDFYASAGDAVREYAGEIFESEKRIGTVNIKSYEISFENKFNAVVSDADNSGDKMKAKDAADKANSGKSDPEENKTEYKTISDAEAALLPSRGAGEQTEIDIPDVKDDAASDTLAGANSNASSIINQFLESSRNDVLTYCYLLDNFKTRVTAQNINSTTNHSGISDENLANWRYADSRGELDMRYRAKNELDTFFATNEVEYVFGGCKSEFANSTIVYSWIYGTRFVNNFAAVYSAYSSVDSWIRYEIDGLAAAASLATAGAVPFTVFKWVFMTAWAAGETALDLALLIYDGYKIPLIKTKNNLFIQNIGDIGNAFDKDLRRNYMKNTNSKLNVCYEDYLIILLSFVDKETRLKRIGDLVQLNMRTRCDPDFVLSSAYTYLKADTTVSIKYMFQPVQQFKNSYKGTGLKFTNTIYQGY